MVDAQHRLSTAKLVDTLAEHATLDVILDEATHAVPSDCRHLHAWLNTPFRYSAPYPVGSRFRRAGRTPGVFYGSRTVATAVAEAAFHRLRFFADSPETPWPANPAEFTAFASVLRARPALDLTEPPLATDRARWTALADYAACQALADAARDAGVDVILYESVRDPERGVNLAVLACRAFKTAEPVERQTWRIDVGPAGVRAFCAAPEQAMAFAPDTWAADPRLTAVRWQR